MNFKMRSDDVMSQDTRAWQVPMFPEKGDLKSTYEKFVISDENILTLMKIFDENLTIGLQPAEQRTNKTSLKMLPTYLHETLYPRHIGKYIALDLGGTNLRFLTVELNGTHYRCKSEQVTVPDNLLVGTADELFDFIAKFLFEGIKKYNIDYSSIPYVGFTFSFPVEQNDLFHGKLITWTKGYNVSGVEGEDVAQLLKKASQKLGLEINRFAIVNDTAGTLLSGALDDGNCYVAIINGTGSNACYMEDLEKIKKYTGQSFLREQMIINIEWGAFGDNGEIDFVRNEYDKLVDEGSIRVGAQRYEKMISGMYLGEIARYLLLDLVKAGHLFGGVTPPSLLQPYKFLTRYLCSAYDLPEMKRTFKNELDIDINAQDAAIISSFSDVIAYRAAQLSSAALAVLVKRAQKHHVVIAADGSMFKKHPTYRSYTHNLIKRYVADKDFTLKIAEDGSGKGAAIAAAVATSFDRRLKNIMERYDIEAN